MALADSRVTDGPPASADSWGVHGGGEGAEDGPTGEAEEGGKEDAAATEAVETETLGDDSQPGDPADEKPPSDGAPTCELPTLLPPEQEAAGGPATLKLRWPRRLCSAFRVSVACTTRLQGAVRRYTPREAYVAQSSGVLNLVQYCVRRAIVERKYRYALRRDALRVNIPAAVRRSLFLHEEEMDFIDKARYAEYLEMFKQVEALYQQLRVHQKELAATEAEYKALTVYEGTLYNDLTRGGGGGLVRKLGGQRAAKKVLQDTQDQLEAMEKTRRNQKESVQRLLKDIKWKYEGNFDSLVATEEFVQVCQCK